MRWFTLLFLCLSISVVTIGCSDDDGSDPASGSGDNDDNDANDGLTFDGTNGFVIEGDDVPLSTMDLQFSSARLESSANGTALDVTLIGTVGSTATELKLIALTGGEMAPGTKDWGVTSEGSHNILLDLGTLRYQGASGVVSGDGQTVYSILGDRIQGSFEGTLVAIGNRTLRIAGKFDLENSN